MRFRCGPCMICSYDVGANLWYLYNVFQIDMGIGIRIGSNAFSMNSLLVSSSIANVGRLGCARSFCMFFVWWFRSCFVWGAWLDLMHRIQALDPAQNPGQNPVTDQHKLFSSLRLARGSWLRAPGFDCSLRPRASIVRFFLFLWRNRVRKSKK